MLSGSCFVLVLCKYLEFLPLKAYADLRSGCVATVMRLPSLSTFKISIDPSWDYVPITLWTELELTVGLLCVSLPSIRILLFMLLPKCVKEYLSNVTRPWRSKSNRTPQQAAPIEQHNWKRPSSWIDITTNSTDFSEEIGKGIEPLALGSGARGSLVSASWKRSSAQPSQFSHLRSDSRRLESAMSNYNEWAVAGIRPPYQEDGYHSTFEQVEMLNIPESHRHSNSSCRSSSREEGQRTALPQIGCIPEGSHSNADLTSDHQSLNAQWSRHEKDML